MGAILVQVMEGRGGGTLTCRSEREGCGCYISPGNGGEGTLKCL